MKLQKILLLACALLMVSMVVTQAQSSEVKAISVSEFEELAKNKGAVRILDVRTPEEMAEGHLPNAKNIDYTNDNFKPEIAKLDKKRTYLLYCKSGIRSGNAASIMKAAGFTHIYSLDGGIEAWQKAGKPIEK
ncbi:rhodanese-like domain-containing protein [Algoriphagus sp. C2-6-M1]|uniref:rhodanese-like domain-containing protein n=1 Tax=Algoriphagus persicinus TaxID=3108754 RepID=UPI002B3EE4B2|nr:rhodanese-like domain-containing protein [Algoriphagus sp. C2-6-M1]MEB2780978.1 rhodanese-like domain-containing protein [Algoriphagus sp. C2-6-M1]